MGPEAPRRRNRLSAEAARCRAAVHCIRPNGQKPEPAGILHADDRVELIDGEIIQMTAIGLRHMVSVNRATTLPASPRPAFRKSGSTICQNDLLLAYREPGVETYSTVLTLRPGDTVTPLAFPDITFQVEELLSTDCKG